MTAALALVGLALLQVPSQESAPDAPAFVEVLAGKETFYAGEVVSLGIRIGIAKTLREEQLLQPFRQRLDLPVRVDAPWLDELEGGSLLPEDDGQDRGAGDATESFVLNGSRALIRRVAEERIGGVRHAVWERTHRAVWSKPGTPRLVAPALRFSYATRFRDDLLSGRVPEDRREVELRGAPLTLRVLALPEEGRPDGYGGAVGRFTLVAEASKQTVEVGESLALRLRIEGEGNFGFFTPPSLDGLPDFHLRGVLEEPDASGLSVLYDLSPTRARVRAVPGVALPYFDPGPPARYRMARTPPIPLHVVGEAADGGPVAEAFALRPLAPAPEGGADRRLGSTTVALALGLPWLLAAVAAGWQYGARRRREGAGAARRAAARCRAALRAPDADTGRALMLYLAARLDCPVSAVITPRLPARLRAHGVPERLADEAGDLLAALFHARFGGEQPTQDVHRCREIVDALEAAFRGQEDLG